MPLDDQELERYARHILLKEVGGPGQEALKSARVLVIGAGGLGAPVLMYLAAAGVGTLGVVDDDVVSLSNLQRQIIHATGRVGTPKTESAAAALADINPRVKVEPHQTRLTAANALEIIAGYDLVVDGSDNFVTRFLVSDACFLASKTLVSAAVGQFDGQVSTFKPHETDPDGTPYPTYRCLNPEAPPPGLVPSCEEAGILGALTGIIGSIQALEAIKEILRVGDSLAGRLLLYDALAARAYVAKLSWDPSNPLNGRNPTIRDLSHHA
jgi:molybdopterin-synthase adenylyltransferase